MPTDTTQETGSSYELSFLEVPFQEAILDSIRHCSPPGTGEVYRLVELIKRSVISAGHDKILAAFEERFGHDDEMEQVLLAKKRAAAAKAKPSETGKKSPSIMKGMPVSSSMTFGSPAARGIVEKAIRTLCPNATITLESEGDTHVLHFRCAWEVYPEILEAFPYKRAA